MKKSSFSGKAKIVVLAAAVIGAVLLVRCIVGYFSGKYGEVTVDYMREFLAGYGWESSPEPQCREIVIPARFSEVYEQYNSIQKEQGYDLSKYRTETVKQYTFDILNYCDKDGNAVENVEAHILVRGGEIIGGDLCSSELYGFMTGFSG